MGSHFHDWIDKNGVAFSIELTEWGLHIRIFGVRTFFTMAVGGCIEILMVPTTSTAEKTLFQ